MGSRHQVAIIVVFGLASAVGLYASVLVMTREAIVSDVSTATVVGISESATYGYNTAHGAAAAKMWDAELRLESGDTVTASFPFLPTIGAEACVVHRVSESGNVTYDVVGYVDALAAAGEECALSNTGL